MSWRHSSEQFRSLGRRWPRTLHSYRRELTHRKRRNSIRGWSIFPEWNRSAYAWTRWIATVTEESTRFQIFKGRVYFFHTTTAQNLPHMLKVNEFADMTTSKFVSQYTEFLPNNVCVAWSTLGTHEHVGEASSKSAMRSRTRWKTCQSGLLKRISSKRTHPTRRSGKEWWRLRAWITLPRETQTRWHRQNYTPNNHTRVGALLSDAILLGNR